MRIVLGNSYIHPVGRGAGWVGVLCTALLLLVAQPAAAVQTHIFDPVLSLTGGCTTSTLDLVPDPGCPGGTHPPNAFSQPKSVATDAFGNVYVGDYGAKADGSTGRIDIFDSTGHFITEVPASNGPASIAVDPQGILYVIPYLSSKLHEVRFFTPTVYKPKTGELAYDAGQQRTIAVPLSIAVNASDGHLFAGYGNHVTEYGSAAEGNKLIDDTIGLPSPEFAGGLQRAYFVAIDAAHDRIYASDQNEVADFSQVRVFELKPPHKLLFSIDGSTTPAKKFSSSLGHLSVATDEKTGHFFIDDLEKKNRVYEFTESGQYVEKIEHGFEYVYPSSIAYANGAQNPNQGYLFVPSGESECCNVFAFEPKREPKPPIVEAVSFSAVTQEEAQLNAEIVPNAPETMYTIEYTTQESFEAEGFVSAVVAGEGELANGKEAVAVSASAAGLSPGITYRIRVFTANGAGDDEAESSFVTFDESPQMPACANQAMRAGASATLPDCRAYELVSPANTGGHPLFAPGRSFSGALFPTPPSSSDGNSVAFMTLGGGIPGYGGAGGFNGDGYVATRDASGWHTVSVGPSGGQTSNPFPGGLSSEHRYAVWTATEAGSLPIDEKPTNYIRYPDGSFQLVGRGSLGIDTGAKTVGISAGGSHIIFTTRTENSHAAVQLEPEAPPPPAGAIYDTTPDGITHVVSLLPGNVTPVGSALFSGASSDGSGVAFMVGDTLYLRRDNVETFQVAGGGPTFAGISALGDRVFYLSGGNLFAFDSAGEETIQITNSGDATPVNVSADGSAVYFVSPSLLTSETNPRGDKAQVGEENLYLWDSGSIRFVATVTERDVDGEPHPNGGTTTDGLGLWIRSVLGDGKVGVDPSRTSPDGNTLLFSSRANLTGYEPGGMAEIYRFDDAAAELDCLSCDPTRGPAGSNASLLSVKAGSAFYGAASLYSVIPNVSPDGKRAFFESSDALVMADTDGVQDVYEWEATGTGGCAAQGGCVHLISSGRSGRPNFLLGVSASGDDVFFSTPDTLLPSDPDATPSIYDARVGGGFPVSTGPAGECLGEACQPAAVSPSDPTPASSSFQGAGNVGRESKPPSRCPKGKRKVHRDGGYRCGAHKKHKKKDHKRTNTNRRTGR